MTKKLILTAIFILGCSVFTFHNESMATGKISPSSGSGDPAIGRQHKDSPPYRILTSRYVSRSTLKRSVDHNNGVRIKILLNGLDNTDIENFSMEYDSGNEYRMGNTYCIENSFLPLYVKVTYRSWNAFHAVQTDVTYEFVVYYPGTWDVTICN
jgi:hypothetical protein